jgi:hypothetical protein
MLIHFLRSLTEKDCVDIKYFMVEKVLAIALDFCAAAIFELSMSKYRMDSKYITRPKYSHISILRTFQESGGWMGLHEYVDYFLRCYQAVYLQYLPEGEGRTLLNQEAQYLEKQHTSILRQVNSALDFVRQEHEAAVTRELERLTKMSFVFIPITSVATILSITEPSRFAWLILITLPLLAVCLYGGNLGRESIAAGSSKIRGVCDLLQGPSFVWSFISKRQVDKSSNMRVEESNIGSAGESKSLSIGGRTATYFLIEEKPDIYENFMAIKAAYAQEKMASLIDPSNTPPRLRHRSGWPSL